MRIAVISDVHGNLFALEAVLDALQPLAPDLVVNLGDLVSGPFDPAGAVDRQMGLGALTIAGNHERQVLAGSVGASDDFARARLRADQLAWLATLPPTLSLVDGEIFASHGSPAGGDLEYLMEDVSTGRARLEPDARIATRLSGIANAGLVLCGHTHVARVVSVGSVLIVNPGSVGMPAYDDDVPVPHVMEAGSPHARFAILERQAGGWSVDLKAVPYDFEAAARQADAAGRPDIAFATRTGRMPWRADVRSSDSVT